MRILSCCALSTFGLLGACTGAPDAIEVELSPSVISSLDGTTHVSAIVVAGTTPLADEAVHLTVAYTDRNGTPHDLAPIDGRTNDRGVFEATLTGLTFDGAGTVTVDVSSTLTAAATFAVLDRTPPKIEILPPTADSKIGPGLPLDVQVHVTDEIGISDVVVDFGSLQGETSTVSTTGALDTTLTFRTQVPGNAQAGPNITLHALARDLSGNLAAATALTLTVDPAITIATPAGLSGTLLTDGTQTQLVSPRAIAVSAMDGHLYVADQAPSGPCSPSCVWRVDAGTGVIDASPVVVGQGQIEGVAFDASTTNLYVSDRQNRVRQLTWNGSAYTNPVACNDPQQQRPQDPFHLLFDATLGILVVDGNAKDVVRIATCAPATVGTQLSGNANFDTPRGIAAGPAGEFYISDNARDRISTMTNAGVVTTFESSVRGPYGMRWLAGGPSAFADSLLVASQGDRVIASTKGTGASTAAFLRNAPIDLALATGTMYVLVVPGNGSAGRIYKVTGL